MIRTFILRLLINGLSLWAAIALLSGINLVAEGNRLLVFVGAALIFTIVNALVRPIVILLSLPAVVITFGLFMFVVNAFMLYVVAFFYKPLEITSFPQALLAALIIWAVNYLLTDLLEGRQEQE